MSAATDLHARLRAATDAAHRALHHHPFMVQRFFAPQMTMQTYAAFLQAFAPPWSSLHTCAVVGMAAHASRWPALARDLAELGHEGQRGQPLSTPDQALGYAYVLIGSTRGAKALRTRVRSQLPDAPTAFLDPDGADEAWEAVLDHLTHAQLPADREQHVVEAALRCFGDVAKGFATAAVLSSRD
ncbi:MAG: biliverdin-producing heme oxygenase [Myxococcales bacterium]|nr:biliverdin-producing heme oxygenase [Myxococcales bacterium]